MTKRIHFKIVLTLFSLAFWSTFSQTYIKTAEFSAYNPTTSEMARFGLTPVNKYVGKANVSIPLYSMGFDGLEIPFTLSYDTGGIKVTQESSWVGLGWNLSGIPTITHVINQVSDVGNGRPGFSDSGLTTGYCYEPTLPTHHSGFDYQELAQGPHYSLGATYDTQPDIFIATLYDSTVTFQLTQKAQTGGVIEARILNGSNARITYNDTSRIFVITDEKGFEYHFPHTELTSNAAAGASLFGGGEIEPQDFFSSSNLSYSFTHDANIPKAWYVDKIISPNNKELKFKYYGEDEGRETYFHLSVPIYSQTRSVLICGLDQNNGTLDGSNFPDPFGTYSALISRVESKIPKEVINLSTGERVVFNTSDRIDLTPFHSTFHAPLSQPHTGFHYEDDKPLKLNTLDVFSSTGEVIKNVVFNNDTYFNSQHASDEYPQNNLRLKLDGVSIDGFNYSFEYDSPDSLPSKTSMDADFWGFYNGANNQKRYPSINFNESFCGIPGAEYNTSGGSIVGGMLGSKFSNGKIGSLTKMTFPTGGYTEYNYESNTAVINTNSNSGYYAPFTYYYLNDNNLEPGYPLTSTQNTGLKTFKVGGLRVNNVKSFDSNNTLLLEKQYKYESLENSSIPISTGKLMSKLYYFDTYNEYAESGNIQFTRLETSSINKLGISNSALGSHVGYDRVEEIIISNLGTATNGKIVTKYLNEPSSNLVGEFAGFQFETAPHHYDNKNGLVMEETFFDKLNNPVKRVENIYSFHQNFVVTGYKMNYGTVTDIFIGIPISINPVSEVYSYSTKKYVPLLTESTVTNFLANGEVSTVVENVYNSKQMTRSTTTSLLQEPNDFNKVEFYYPYDTDYGLSSYPRMNSLVSENRIASPTYVRMYKNNQLIGHELQPYGIFSSTVQPSGVNFQKEEATLSNIEQRIIYDSYDDYGNITQVTQPGGASSKYLWGHEAKQLVASIKNAPTDSGTTPVEDVVDMNVLYNTKLSTSINSELDLLRAHPDYQNAQIQSYAYNPSGMVQSSDTRGYRMNYAYDNKERLTEIRDNDNAILSQNSYNYLNESQPCSDCKAITLNTSSYTYFRTQNLTLNISMPSGIPSVQSWKVDFGDGNISEGNGNPPTSLNYSYSIDEPYGLKVIRMYTHFNDQSFVTGNINVRVAEGTIPGEDVRFGNIQTVSTPDGHPKKTARIYGSSGAQVSYKTFIAGSTSEQYGHTSVTGGGSHSLSGNYQIEYGSVTIPSSGYVDCAVEVLYSPGGNLHGTVNLVLTDTTVGQIGSPASLNVSQPNNGGGW